MTVTTHRHERHKCHSFASRTSPPSLDGDVVTVTETVTVRSGLRDLARRVRRLAPSHRDPERFHEDKSEIVYELLTLARAMEGRRG